ncbi:ankyrin repeat-containing domain protein [Lactarius sanguifluus]|nr:ankyrin repeat-containing domain protein [Lactarius sanguifluus]
MRCRYVEARTSNRQTALHLAALKNHSEIATLLLENGANANAKSLDELTPLLCAAQEGQLDVMRVLLLHAADVRARTPKGEIALHIAARDNYLMAAPPLLERGFNVNDRTPVSGGGETTQVTGFRNTTISRGSPTPIPSAVHYLSDSPANSALSGLASGSGLFAAVFRSTIERFSKIGWVGGISGIPIGGNAEADLLFPKYF